MNNRKQQYTYKVGIEVVSTKLGDFAYLQRILILSYVNKW